MFIEEVDYLKHWLVAQLQAISEADPSVLAKYVIALLKKDDTFVQETFIEQLEVFLDDATIPFVRNLYDVIETKEYLPQLSKKKRVFTESPQNEEHKSERKVSIEPQLKSTEQRLVELSVCTLDDDEKLSARKRRFDDDRSHRKRTSRNPPRDDEIRRNASRDEEIRRNIQHDDEVRRYSSDLYDDRRENRRYNERADRTRSDDGLRERYTRDAPRVHERVGYPKRRYSPDRRYSRSPSPRRSRSPQKSMSPPRNGKSRKERCRDFDEKGYCLRGGLCPYDHGMDPVVVEESSLSSVLQAAQTPAPPPQPIFAQQPIFPPGETYNPDKPSMMLPPLNSLPLPPPPPVATITSTVVTPPITDVPPRPYIHRAKRVPSSTGPNRSFKLVDGVNIVTGVVAPVEHEQKTLIIRDIPTQSNDSALLSHHLGRYGPIKQLQCKVYNDIHTATVEFHSHASAVQCFNSTDALMGLRYIKLYWKEVVPITLAPSYFTGTLAKASSIHQSMNLVNTPAVVSPTVETPAPVVKRPPPTPFIPREPQKLTVAKKKLELAKRTQGFLYLNITNQKLILSKLEKCKSANEKKILFSTLKKLQEAHASIKPGPVTGTEERKRKIPPPRTTRGAATNLDLRPREILVKNCRNAEELQVHFSKFGQCNVIPSGVGVIIGFDTRRDAEMAYVKGRMIEGQELDIEWNKDDAVQSSQVPVEPIR